MDIKYKVIKLKGGFYNEELKDYTHILRYGDVASLQEWLKKPIRLKKIF